MDMVLIRNGQFPQGPEKKNGVQFCTPQKWAPKGPVTLTACREDWYSGNEGDIGGVERGHVVCIFGRGVRGLERPRHMYFWGAFPPKERAVLRAALGLISARLAAMLVRWSVK